MALEYYKYVHEVREVIQPKVVTPPEDTAKGRPLITDAIKITLAQYDRDTKNFITAHNIKDYRRKTFRLTLLPDVHVLFDVLLEGSGYWYEKLHPESKSN